MTRLVAAMLPALGILLGTMPVANAETCNTTISDKTINANVVVPAGATCDLENVIVTGSVRVEKGAFFLVQISSSGSTQLIGDVIAIQCGFVFLGASGRSVSVGGNVQISGCTGPSYPTVSNATISGNFQCFNNVGCQVATSTIGGNAQINNNSGYIALNNNYVGGNLQCLGNATGGSFIANAVAGNNQGQCKQS